MTEKGYNEARAYHYAAYRPPLHTAILREGLGSEPFTSGLDLGCGMGHSSLALRHWCNEVIGIDPSMEMIQRAIPEKGVRYVQSDGKNIPSNNSTFDVITLAGSWFYAQSKEMYQELIRVSKDKGVILLYDFSIDFTRVKKKLGLSIGKLDYQHDCNLDSYIENHRIQKTSEQVDHTVLEPSPENLAHMIMSEDDWQESRDEASFEKLRERITSECSNRRLPVATFYYRYDLVN